MEKVFITEGLIVELKQGDERAFASVFKSYFPRLCQFARTYVVDEAVAKNMAQDAFMKLWENRETLREESSIIAYLLVLTKNICLDYLKHLKVEIKHQNAVLVNSSEIALNYHALRRLEIDLLDYKEMQQIIDKTVESLPPQCRIVFTMSRFENMSNAEIAEKLDIGVKAVEANITRALKIFRFELKDYLAIMVLLNIPFR